MEHTFELIRRSQAGDKETKEQLIKENSGLIWNVVRRFAGRGCETEDLYQIGAIGLLRAVERFDFGFEVRFSTYAMPLIAGEIRRFLRDDGMIKVSRTLKEALWKIKRTEEELRHELGREPAVEEIAGRVGMETGEIIISLEANSDVESIDQEIFQKDGKSVSLGDRLASERDENEETLNRLFLEQLLGTLPEREQRLIRLRFYENRTQSQSAELLGISQVQVSRMEKKILRVLRECAGRG